MLTIGGMRGPCDAYKHTRYDKILIVARDSRLRINCIPKMFENIQLLKFDYKDKNYSSLRSLEYHISFYKRTGWMYILEDLDLLFR